MIGYSGHTMKVILLKDVKGMGRAHEQIEATDGHALNFLIPKKMAVAATTQAVKEATVRRAQVQARGAVETKLVEERLAALAEERIVVQKKANEQGHLYDALDAKEIAQLTSLPVEAIHIEKPFKELGTFEVPVALGEVFGKISVTIEAE